MNWQPTQLLDDQWIIEDRKMMEEYKDPNGDNLVFESWEECQFFIDELNRAD